MLWYTEGLDDQVLLHGFIPTNMTNKFNRIRWNYTQNMNKTEQLHRTLWNYMNDRTRNDLQQRVNDVIAEYYP